MLVHAHAHSRDVCFDVKRRIRVLNRIRHGTCVPPSQCTLLAHPAYKLAQSASRTQLGNPLRTGSNEPVATPAGIDKIRQTWRCYLGCQSLMEKTHSQNFVSEYYDDAARVAVAFPKLHYVQCLVSGFTCPWCLMLKCQGSLSLKSLYSGVLGFEPNCIAFHSTSLPLRILQASLQGNRNHENKSQGNPKS